MIREKYAIRFPDIQNTQAAMPECIFSERSVAEAEHTFNQTFDLLHSLTGYVIQRNRTRELEKQLDARKEAVDAQAEQQRKQKQMEFEEYSKRLQIQLKTEKEQMELEIKRLHQEMSAMVSMFSVSVEEAIQESQIWRKIILDQKNFLQLIQPFIESLTAEYSYRREYVLYCDAQRRSYEIIDKFMKEII